MYRCLWEGRFRSVAILDAASLLAMCAYIDLNPVAAGVATLPEKSPHTSIKSRVDHCATQGHLDPLRGESPYHSKANAERGHWLLPIEDRRDKNGNGLVGMLRGVSLSGYLQLIDWSSRLIRPRKVNLTADVPHILTRLRIDATSWQGTWEKLIKTTKFVGTYFGSDTRLNETATQRGIKYLKNVTGRETPLTIPHAS